MSRNRVKVPGQVNVECTAIPAPNAFPLIMTLNMPDGPKCVAWGGLTKLEWMAGMVAASAINLLPPNKDSLASVVGGMQEIQIDVATEVCSIAQAILAECERRQHATQKGNGQIEAS